MAEKMYDEFDSIFEKTEDVTPAKIIEKKHDSKKNSYKKLGDYSDCDEVKESIKKSSKFKFKFNLSKYKSDLFKLTILIVIIVTAVFFILAVNDGKFQSNYSNNLTVESDIITIPAPIVNNAYDFKPVTNITVEATEVDCNCNYEVTCSV